MICQNFKIYNNIVVEDKYYEKTSDIGRKLKQVFGVFDLLDFNKEDKQYISFVKCVMAMAQYYDDYMQMEKYEDRDIFHITNGGYLNLLMFILLEMKVNSKLAYDKIFDWINNIIEFSDELEIIYVFNSYINKHPYYQEILDLLSFLSNKGYTVNYIKNISQYEIIIKETILLNK